MEGIIQLRIELTIDNYIPCIKSRYDGNYSETNLKSIMINKH